MYNTSCYSLVEKRVGRRFLLFHFVDDGGGVYVKTQSRAKLKEPFGYGVQFIEGEIYLDRFRIVIFVVLVVL